MSRVRIRILVLCLALIFGLLVGSVPQTIAQGNSYMVQSGDTLFSIAMRYNTTPELLMAFNGLFSPTIYIGQLLTVPSAPTGAAPAPTGAAPAPAASSGTVVVQEGDTLFSLATRHGMTVAKLKALNGLTTDYIYIGQVLKVSGNAAPPAPVPPASSDTIVVQEGDTLFSIATRHGMTVANLKALNGLSTDYIDIGQVLKLSGNAAPAAAAPPPMPAASRTYIVQPNDTLYSIAVRHGSSVFALKKINGLVDDHIYVGQVLNLSGNTTAPAVPTPAPAPVVPAPAPSSASGTYVVQPGDTLFRIALGHNTTVAALKALNGLTSDHIYAGQILKISGHVEATQPPSPPNAPPPPKHEQHHEPRHGEDYIVQVGDTLSLIATRYKTTVGALMKANRLTSDTILIGQSLFIPGRGKGRHAPRAHHPGTYYTVQGGDTLSHIAAKYRVSLGALAQVNNLRSNNWIYIGQRLLIPKGEHAPAPPPAVVPPTVPNKDYYHIVRPGETLSQIAWHYKTSVDAIVKANHLKNANELFIGQRLYISGYHPPAAKPHPKPAPVATAIPATHPPATATRASRATPTPIPATYPPATATTARVASSVTAIPPTYPRATATTARVASSATAIPATALPAPPATSTAVRLAPSATASVDTASEPPYVPPASEQPPVVEPEPTAARSAARQAVWTAQVFTDECGTEDTRHFTSAVRVNVEGREDQEVDLFVYPIQESNFITWGKTGSKPVLGPFGVEFAPLGAGNYAVSVPGVGFSPSFYVDGDCIAHINFGLGGP